MKLFVPDDGERHDLPREVVAARLEAGPGPSPYWSWVKLIDLFGSSKDAYQQARPIMEARHTKENPTRSFGESYTERAFAEAIGYCGPLPYEIKWFRTAISRPATLKEIQSVYVSPEWVYRCYRGAEIVYVGITSQGLIRMHQHMASSPWLLNVDQHRDRALRDPRGEREARSRTDPALQSEAQPIQRTHTPPQNGCLGFCLGNVASTWYNPHRQLSLAAGASE